MAVKVPAKVLEGLNEIKTREGGMIDMLSLRIVMQIAREIGNDECANWVYDNVSLYVVGVFEGFEKDGLADDNKRVD